LDIGGDLKRARMARHLSLADISKKTKISPSVLRAIETNHFEFVAGGLFARGFLRAFAREVELDPEPLVQSYRAEFEAHELQASAAATQRAAASRSELIKSLHNECGTKQLIGLGTVLLIGFAYGVPGHVRTASRSNALKPSDAIQMTAASLVTVPVATTGALGTPSEMRGHVPLKLELEATGPCWVAVFADGKQFSGRLLNAGEHQQFLIRDELMLRVGDPATLTFTIDGVAGKSLGSRSTPVNVRITRENYKIFLASQ
jgi:transcriptional regulator with XRE-family HTH domain